MHCNLGHGKLACIIIILCLQYALGHFLAYYAIKDLGYEGNVILVIFALISWCGYLLSYDFC